MPILSVSVLRCFVCLRSLGSYSGLETCCSLQVNLEIEPSDSQLVEKDVKVLY